jgi:hypothetical protein
MKGDKKRRPRMDDKMAIAFAGEEFEKRHPRETWPEWLRPCTVVRHTMDDQRRFVVSFAVSIQEPLKADEHWEEINGERRIVWVDPKTAKKLVVFRDLPTITYFKAVVDPETAEVTVLIDRDLSTIADENLAR